jgi:CheY-like chemotaxis protein
LGDGLRWLAEIYDVMIVAFTALHSGECRASAFATGCNDYVQKRIDMEQLSGLLDRHLGKGRS